jgi:hypothetical protein
LFEAVSTGLSAGLSRIGKAQVNHDEIVRGSVEQGFDQSSLVARDGTLRRSKQRKRKPRPLKAAGALLLSKINFDQ